MKDYNKYRDQNLMDSEKAVKFARKYNLKRIVAGRGHDMGGLIADLCIGRKVIAQFLDDGWGGEPTFTFMSVESETEFKADLKANEFGKELFLNGGYGFCDSIEDIGEQSEMTAFVEFLQQINKHTKLMRKTKNKLIIGTDYQYREVFWKGLKSLSDLPRLQLQRTYDKYKSQLKDGEKFFNTDEQLLSLGIKI